MHICVHVFIVLDRRVETKCYLRKPGSETVSSGYKGVMKRTCLATQSHMHAHMFSSLEN